MVICTCMNMYMPVCACVYMCVCACLCWCMLACVMCMFTDSLSRNSSLFCWIALVFRSWVQQPKICRIRLFCFHNMMLFFYFVFHVFSLHVPAQTCTNCISRLDHFWKGWQNISASHQWFLSVKEDIRCFLRALLKLHFHPASFHTKSVFMCVRPSIHALWMPWGTAGAGFAAWAAQ